jgi:hypothetical protein
MCVRIPVNNTIHEHKKHIVKMASCPLNVTNYFNCRGCVNNENERCWKTVAIVAIVAIAITGVVAVIVYGVLEINDRTRAMFSCKAWIDMRNVRMSVLHFQRTLTC